jgi:membrane associated rhomboid family serine protease
MPLNTRGVKPAFGVASGLGCVWTASSMDYSRLAFCFGLAYLAASSASIGAAMSSSQSPINPLPPAVVALAAIVFGVEVMFNLAERGLLGGPAGIGWRSSAIQNYGFFGEVLDWMIQNQRMPLELLVRFVSYPLLHMSFTHALFVCVFILAMGKMVGEALGGVAVWVLFFVPSILGAVAYGLLLDDPYPLVGGYPGVYGLIGGYTYLLWLRLGAMGEKQLMAFRLIGVLLGIQFVFGLLFGGGNDWVADLVGFGVGFGLSGLFVPGGLARLRARLKGR